MRTISVHTQPDYRVELEAGLSACIGERLRERFSPCTVLLVSDDNVQPLYGRQMEEALTRNGFTVQCFTFPHGEGSKTPATLVRLWETAAGCLTRSDLFLALGGGVTGDLTGFAAATTLRGIPYAAVPTSLLAMVDSSVGGKTAVDLAAGKNLAGAFHQPSYVLCDPTLLKTLPEKYYRDGMAEVIKYGCIDRPVILDLLEQDADMADIIYQCIDDKRALVEADEHDHGVRQLLNFGHTPAHAIERLSGYSTSHGFAVAAGMAIMTRAAVHEGLCERRAYDRLEGLLRKYSLPLTCPYTAEALAEAALHDKKRQGDTITLVLPTASGCILQKTPTHALPAIFERGLTPLE